MQNIRGIKIFLLVGSSDRSQIALVTEPEGFWEICQCYLQCPKCGYLRKNNHMYFELKVKAKKANGNILLH